MRRLIALALFLLVVSLSGQADTVRITNGEWPPYLSQHYNHFGVASHIVPEALKLENFQVEYGFFPWVRSLEFAEDGIWDASIVWTFSRERETRFLYSEPVIKLRSVFFHRRDKVFEWEALEDLKGYRIGGTIGYYYGPELSKLEKSGKLNISRVRSDAQNLKLILADRLDLFPIELEVGYEVLHRNFPSQQINLITTTRPFRETSYYMIVSRKSPKANSILKAFNQGLVKLKESGRFDEMIDSAAVGGYHPVSELPK
ncbi:substrate-binding periplasmic protein [Hahella ganghwensis]|uniref:substrate-binding periplasmic protein n=1 Tax=Hahella ganghwensis TaxID=286420 RepID=UPI000372A3F8|nr:transporter substrate-binding domain-containing protein [Hahella ganghwensis]